MFKKISAFLLFASVTMTSFASPMPRALATGLLQEKSAVQPSSIEPKHDSIGSVHTFAALSPDSIPAIRTDYSGVSYTAVQFRVPAASGLRLHFRNVHLSEGANLIVYGLSGNNESIDMAGPYTGAGPMQTGEFWTPAIHGEYAVVEWVLGKERPSDIPFEVPEAAILTDAELANAPRFGTLSDNSHVEVRRSLYKGVIVEHEIRDGVAYFEGDIVMGRAEDMVMAPRGKRIWRDSTAASWSTAHWPGGVMPYVIDPALTTPSRVTDAVAAWNTQLNGVIQIVPRTTQANYVVFTPSTDPSNCSSNVGMVGGPQYTYLGDYCATGNVEHEIGHDLGLWHEHTRSDRNTYVTINTANIISSAMGNFSQTGTSGIDLGSYDYNSIMHYPSYAFSSNGLPTIVTIPAGIPIGQRNGLSSGDIAGITQYYGGPKAPTTMTQTVTTNPAGLQVVVDNGTATAPYTGTWTVGSAHSVNAPTPPAANGQLYTFSSWSDGGAQSHTVTASTSTSVLTATFAVSYQLSTSVAPSAGGTITISPTSTSGYYPANTVVSVTAVPASGYCFSSWTGLLSGTGAATSITMTKAYTLTANFAQCATTQTVFSPIRVHAGGGAYTDANGNYWNADYGSTGGNTYYTTAPVANTSAPALYQSERWSYPTLQYQFSVPNGTYTVNLKFAEIWFSTCGNRVFNIVVNGQTVASNFDPCAAGGGSNKAVDQSYSVNATNGQIVIQLVSVISNPKISAIEIVQSGTATSSTGNTTPPPTTTTPPPTTQMTKIRVNAGGGSYTDASGNVWSGDSGFLGGYTYGVGVPVANTSTSTLYQTEHWNSGTLQYQATVPNGTYTINLKFAEIWFTSAGNRIFNIVINGQTVATNFDPCAAAGGPNIAVDRSYTVTVTNGQIVIQFVSVISNPKVSAIEILQTS